MSDYINIPFSLNPAAKDYIWGGNKLNTVFNKNIDIKPFAESWECSTHPDGLSTVADGPFCGRTLKDVLSEHPEFLGTENAGISEMPVLVKLIDADKDLSVQVHPDDEYAYKYENGQNGKTEMWYVIDSDPGSTLVYGLNRNVDRETLRNSIFDGSIEKYLNKVKVKKGDSFFITPGTIHAIGKGLLIAEIQQSSNLTYRLYDYNRTDSNGNKRALHIDKAIDVAVLTKAVDQIKSDDENIICRCDYFCVSKLYVSGCTVLHCTPKSYTVMLCVSGCGIIVSGCNNIKFTSGKCIFVPASEADVSITGNSEFLVIR